YAEYGGEIHPPRSPGHRPRMRWSIRYQLLAPLLTLLLGVVGMSVWAALASAGRARHQLEEQLRDIVRTVVGSGIPLDARAVLEQMTGISHADYLLVSQDAEAGGKARHRVIGTTLEVADVELPPPTTDDWENLSLDLRVTLGGKAYLCNGVRLRHRSSARTIL